MNLHLKAAALAGIAALAVSGVANAAIGLSTTVGGTPGSAADPSPLGALITFEGAQPVGGITGNYQIVSGLLPNNHAAPSGDVTHYLSVPQNLALGNTATLDLAAYGIVDPIESFSFYWGSVDKYNTLNLYDATHTLLGSVTGSAVSLLANGNQGSQQTNLRVKFDLPVEAQGLRYLEFKSTNYAFEVDNIAFKYANAVPEPATWAMMILGFLGVGSTVRFQRRRGALAL